MQAMRLYLFLEAAAFIVAALTHFGLLIGGYEHLKAGIAESVIAALLAGFGFTWIRPDVVRKTGLATQTFALLGTLVGIFTIAIGVGPRATPDIAYHIVIIPVLASGLIAAFRVKPI
ncbi:MAG: hypothetical protein ACREQ2_06005 [Candidatus Binatia bacterium]